MIIPRMVSTLYGLSAKNKIVADMSNRELIDKVEQLLEEQRKKNVTEKKKNPSKIMHIEYGDPEAQAAFDRKRTAILKAIEAIDTNQED